MVYKCIEIPWGNQCYFKLGCPHNIFDLIKTLFPQTLITDNKNYDAILLHKSGYWQIDGNDEEGLIYFSQKFDEEYLSYKIAISIEEMIEMKINSLVLHGGAVSKNNKAIIFCQQRRAGKTVLLTDLLSEEGVEYLSDDIIFVNNDDVSGIGMPLRLRENSIKGIRMSGTIVGIAADPDGGKRFFYVPSCPYYKGNAKLRAIILPNYGKENKNLFVEISGKDKFSNLIVNVRKPNNMEYLYKTLVKLCNKVPIYKLDYNDITFAWIVVNMIWN